MSPSLSTHLQPSSSQTLVFIDSQLENYQFLVKGRLPSETVLILASDRDGVAQITEALATYATVLKKITAVHIFSHGSSGCLQLGNTILSQANLSGYQSEWQQWTKILNQGANVFLYGCEVAREEGANFVKKLSQIIGFEVAAATEKIGKDYSWDLGFKTGEISAPLALKPEIRAAYPGILATLTVTNNNDSGVGSLRAAISAAAAGDIITFDPSLANKTITLTSGQLAITKDLTLDAASASNLTISGNNSSRILEVGSVKFTLKNLKLTQGKLTGSDEA
ncbi:MAG: DUF4347 domain-containing protein, partial [Actinomycetota bacterium]